MWVLQYILTSFHLQDIVFGSISTTEIIKCLWNFLIVGTYMHNIIFRNTRSKYIKWKKYYVSLVKVQKKTDDKNENIKLDYTKRFIKR